MIFFRVSEFVLQAEGEHVVLQVGGETVECRARLVAHDVVVGSELQPFHNVPCGAEADGPSQCVGDARPARAERIARYFRIGVVDVVFGYQREGRILDVVGEKDVTAPERTQVGVRCGQCRRIGAFCWRSVYRAACRRGTRPAVWSYPGRSRTGSMRRNRNIVFWRTALCWTGRFPSGNRCRSSCGRCPFPDIRIRDSRRRRP